MDFEQDAYEQIKRMNKLATLDRAARLAGEQLESLKPAVMAPTSRGFYAGPAAYVNRGNVLIVVADAKRVFTIHCAPPEDCPTVLRKLVDAVKDSADLDWTPAAVAQVALEAVKQYGGKPGEKTAAVDEIIVMKIVGALFACYSPEQLHGVGSEVDELIRLNVCPAFVCLVGPSTSGKPNTYALSTMLLPLAPYLETVTDVAA